MGHDHDHGHTHDHAGRVDDALTASKAGIRAVIISLVILALTATIQIAIVAVSGSVALLADTIHNFSDALTAIPLWIAFSLSRRSATRRYTYGLGRAEDLAGLFVVAVIAASAVVAGVEAVRRLVHPVPVSHLGHMRTLLDQIPPGTMNTSMTINATAMWLLAMYEVVAEEQAQAAGEDVAAAKHLLAGTTQNDIIKEYLSRGTYAFPPEPSMRLIADMVAFTVNEIPSWNPINICSYHLQEAGATPVQEIAYAMSTAIAVLDEVKARGQVSDEDFPKVFGRISYFVNAGVRFVEEIAKLKAMGGRNDAPLHSAVDWLQEILASLLYFLTFLAGFAERDS